MIYFTGEVSGQIQDGQLHQGKGKKEIEETSNSFMHAPLGLGGYIPQLVVKAIGCLIVAYMTRPITGNAPPQTLHLCHILYASHLMTHTRFKIFGPRNA